METIFNKILRHRERETRMADNLLSLKYIEVINDIKSWDEFRILMEKHHDHPDMYKYKFNIDFLHDVFVLGHGSARAAKNNNIAPSNGDMQLRRLQRFLDRRVLLGSLKEMMTEEHANHIYNQIVEVKRSTDEVDCIWREMVLSKMSEDILITKKTMIISAETTIERNEARRLLQYLNY